MGNVAVDSGYCTGGEGISMMFADNFCLPVSHVMIQHYVWPGRKSDGLISRSLLKTGQNVTDVNMIFYGGNFELTTVGERL